MGKNKKKICGRMRQRQQAIRHIENTLETLSEIGLIGEEAIRDGQRSWRIGPEHRQIAMTMLQYPEYWPDTWTDEQRRQLYALRDTAIAKGVIQA